MSSSVLDRDRQVIPRWRASSVAAGLGELGSGTPRPAQDSVGELAERRVRRRVAELEQRPGPGLAGDLLGAALVGGMRDEGRLAADYFVRYGEPATSLAVQVAGRWLDSETRQETEPSARVPEQIEADARVAIQELKRALARDPRNALARCDIALEYTVLGQSSQALRAMQVCLDLVPENRLLLRSAARLFIHEDDVDRAQSLLESSELVRTDPWVMAAEIAASAVAGRRSKNIRRGLRLLESEGFHPLHVAELAAAVGTLELQSGNSRRGRRLFKQALEQPNENALAQAGWVQERGIDLDVDPSQDVPRSFEAHAVMAAEAGNWEESVAQSLLWLEDQTFASEPAVFASWVASMGVEDFGLAATVAQVGLIANPDDALLRNNLVFSLAPLDLVDEAERELSRIDAARMTGINRAVLSATQGLIHYRRGRIDDGRSYYLKAIREAAGPDAPRVRANAAVLMLQEEMRLGRSDFPEELLAAVVDAVEAPYPEVARRRGTLVEALKADRPR